MKKKQTKRTSNSSVRPDFDGKKAILAFLVLWSLTIVSTASPFTNARISAAGWPTSYGLAAPDEPLSAEQARDFLAKLNAEIINVLNDELDLNGVNSEFVRIANQFNRRGPMAGKTRKQIVDLYLTDIRSLIKDASVLEGITTAFAALLASEDTSPSGAVSSTAAPPASTARVKGTDATMVVVEKNPDDSQRRLSMLGPKFVFRQTGPGTWSLYNSGNENSIISSCSETGRDEWSVYLNCSGLDDSGCTGGMCSVALDLWQLKAKLPGSRTIPLMGNVTDSSSAPVSASGQVAQNTSAPTTTLTADDTGTLRTATRSATDNSLPVRRYLDSLQYSEAALLAEPAAGGTTIPAPRGPLGTKPSPGGGAVIVCTEVRRNEEAEFSDISILSPVGSTIYPGALVYANQDLRRGTPRGLTRLKRAPVVLIQDLAGLKKRIELTDSENLFTEYEEKLARELDDWNTTNQQLPQDLRYENSGRAKYQITTAYNRQQIAVALKVDAKWASGEASLDAAFNDDRESNDVVAKFQQIFYTVNYQEPTAPERVFDPSVTKEELEREGRFDANNAPAYVSSVSYGRTIFVRMNVDNRTTAAKAKAAFEYGKKKATGELAQGVKVDGEAEYESILKSSSLTVVVIGGNSRNALETVADSSPASLRRVITGDNAVYSTRNPGVPISYTVKFLKDNKLATVKSATEYNAVDCEEFENFKLRIRQLDGGYIADATLAFRHDQCKPGGVYERFALTKPIDKNLVRGVGDRIALDVPFRAGARNLCFLQYYDKPVGWFEDIEIPGNATEIRVYLVAHFFINDFRTLQKGSDEIKPADFKNSKDARGNTQRLCLNMRGTTFSRFADWQPCQ